LIYPHSNQAFIINYPGYQLYNSIFTAISSPQLKLPLQYPHQQDFSSIQQFFTSIIVFTKSSSKNMKSSFFILTNSNNSNISSSTTHGYRFIRFLTAKPQKLLGPRSIFTTSHSNRSFKTVNRNQGLWYQELKM
jgi:hypothetical protein